MKKRYLIFGFIFIFEFFVISILNESKFKVDNWIGSAIGTFVFLAPIQILLFLLSKDNNLSKRTQMCCKVVFWFISICYILGGVASLVG